MLGVIKCRHHVFDWVVDERRAAPDNHEASVIAINGMFPGPTINVTMGDSVEVNIRNRLGRPFTLHWHGITQKNSQNADGVPYVTQDPIPHNAQYKYRFSIPDQAGTFWYHAHTKLDADVAFGALIVHEPKPILNKAMQLDPRFKYAEERVLLLSEIWHKSNEEMYDRLTSSPFRSFPTPNSILTNGRTYAEWDQNASPNLPFNDGYSIITVKPNTRYRLRIIGAQDRSFFTFQIPGHRFTVIEADGTLVKPFETDHVDINSGQRYSVILQTNTKPQNYLMYTTIIGGGSAVKNGIAILHYEGSQDPTLFSRSVQTMPPNPRMASTWFDDQLATLISHDIELPTSFTQSSIINAQLDKDGDLSIYKINNVIHRPRNTTLLPSIFSKTYTPAPGMVDIRSDGQGVQMVLQNLILPGIGCSPHPWHMHGHSFYVVARGEGIFDPRIHNRQIEASLRKNPSPILRDTFTLFPSGTQPTYRNTAPASSPPGNPQALRSCGWTAIRFKANNPGSWIMHCHIAAHMVQGMQFLLNEHPN
ncbi:hypothetical protein DSO57_1018516 [Entomophthora muscae]|uniref:Uncharacterized protein n=1 Tax=Entomophthora muscae TaxID=34485 RepID=A0ACC2T540_9FUNG|nr:hypothetical protein DSO57_1018516 [Entomophthora muscae]